MADRPGTASRTDEDSPHRLTAHVNMCKVAQEVQEPRASSRAGSGREGTTIEDIATPREDLEKDKPHKKNSDFRESPTHAKKGHMNGHKRYRRKPTHNNAQYKTTKIIRNNLVSPQKYKYTLVKDNNDPHNRKHATCYKAHKTHQSTHYTIYPNIPANKNG